MNDPLLKPMYAISITAEIVGVHPRTLMIYEREGLVIPQRTVTNRRRYCQKDLHALIFIRFLMHEQKLNLSGCKAVIKLLSEAETRGLQLQKIIFPSFKPQRLF